MYHVCVMCIVYVYLVYVIYNNKGYPQNLSKKNFGFVLALSHCASLGTKKKKT